MHEIVHEFVKLLDTVCDSELYFEHTHSPVWERQGIDRSTERSEIESATLSRKYNQVKQLRYG